MLQEGGVASLSSLLNTGAQDTQEAAVRALMNLAGLPSSGVREGVVTTAVALAEHTSALAAAANDPAFAAANPEIAAALAQADSERQRCLAHVTTARQANVAGDFTGALTAANRGIALYRLAVEAARRDETVNTADD